ncbi:MAG: hypothetical protein AAF442_04070 [Pseudomonadota bacterium]
MMDLSAETSIYVLASYSVAAVIGLLVAAYVIRSHCRAGRSSRPVKEGG